VDSTLVKNKNDVEIRLKYSNRALRIPLLMGAGFSSWGLFNFFTNSSVSADLESLFISQNWPLFFGLVYFLSFAYMHYFGYMVVNSQHLKKTDIFQRKVEISKIKACKSFSKDYIIQSDKNDLYISSSVIAADSLRFLLKFLKENNIPMT
jgi:hypothetical protein